MRKATKGTADQWQWTNRDRADVIDALEIAIDTLTLRIDRVRGSWSRDERYNHHEWESQRRRYRKLRRGLVAAERESLKSLRTEFVKLSGRHG